MTYQPSASSNLYPSDLSASGISGYLQLAKPPLILASEVDLPQTVVDTDGEVLMQTWISAALGLAEIAAGTWSFYVFGYVDTVDGASEIVIRVYSRNAVGTETELFDVTTGSITAVAAGYTISSSQGVLSLAAVTDRLVVKFFAKTSSTTTRTVHLCYLGEVRQTRMSLPVELAIVPGGDMLASLYDTDQDGQISSGGGGSSSSVGSMVYNNANISIPNNTATALTFNSEVWDTDNCHSTVSNTSRLTCNTAGVYMVVGHAWFAANGTGTRSLQIYKNGVAVANVRIENPTAGGSTLMMISKIIDLAVNDYVEFYVLQSSGGNLNVSYSSGLSPYFAMQKF